MFTGIIQEIGTIKSVALSHGNLVLDIAAKQIAARLEIGASVSINGACQTVVSRDRERFKVEAVKETLSRTNLGALKSGSPVNIELPLGLNDLLHGHLVQGHIDCVAEILEIKPLDGSHLIKIAYPQESAKYVIEKGSIAIDGVSLTITQTTPTSLTVSVIPHTMENTVFRDSKAGDRVNLEFDMIAKYIERMISPRESKINSDFLREHGF
jgi:riboflavin synthase